MGDEEKITITRSDLDRIVSESSDRAIRRVLKELGLEDDDAVDDLRELRALLSSWREVRKSALQALVKFLTTAVLGALLLGLGIRLGASNLLK